jgi:hypothetical protein
MKFKRFGFMLLVVLLLGFVGAASAAEKVIFTDGLEDIDAEANVPKGWVVFSNNNGDYGSASKDIVRSGSLSWFMDDPSSTASLGIRSPKIPAEAGKIYRAASYVFVLSGTANLYIEFWDADGTRLGPQSTKNTVRNEWEEIFVTKEAPAGTKFVSLILYSQQTNTGAHYFDDVTIMEID